MPKNNKKSKSNKNTDQRKKNLKERSSQSSVSSTESQSSLKSIGMGPSLRVSSTDIRDLTRTAENTKTSRLTPEGGSPPGETIFDCIAYVIHCPVHERVAVSKVERAKAVWLPFVACPPNKTWKDASQDGVSTIFNKQDSELDAKLGTRIPIREMLCLHVFRFQVPIKQRFFVRNIFYVKLNKNTKTFKCCQNTQRIQWLPMNDVLAANVEKVWGPEVSLFGRLAKEAKPQGIDEFGLEHAFFYVPKDPPRNLEEAMLKALEIGEKEVEKLYNNFIEHCFPAFYMTIYSFKDYMTKYSYHKNDSRFPLLFNAFNYNKNGYLSFHELLLGLALMEPITANGEARIKFVFRYYDTDGDGFLCESEFKKLVKDISPKDDENTLEIKVRDGMKVIGLKNNKIDLANFCKAVGSKTFRGTSNLCRSPKAILSQISHSTANITAEKSSTKKAAIGSLKADRKSKGICLGCRGKKYYYGLHSIRLDTNGRCVEPRTIFEPGSVDNEISAQTHSMEYVFNTRSIGNIFIDLIRDFDLKKGTVKEPRGFMSSSIDRKTFIKYLQYLCSDLESLLVNEDRVIKINSPACIVADIYGNLEDLLTMEKLLWQQFPIISANYVFLGNFVDKGKWGIECALYLFALKLIAPNKIYLLRGNHEVRQVQIQNSFRKECLHKYGQKLGQTVWETVNKVFDKLALSIIIDETIFCSHGGIPMSTLKVDDIRTIAPDLKNPEKDSTIAWELISGKPATQQQIIESSTIPLTVPNKSGFMSEKKCESEYLYDESAAKNFLKSNGFSHIIQGNEMTTTGFKFYFSGICLTLFSCSHFCGNNNESAAIFVDSGKIRIVRLDTSKNRSATDDN